MWGFAAILAASGCDPGFVVDAQLRNATATPVEVELYYVSSGKPFSRLTDAEQSFGSGSPISLAPGQTSRGRFSVPFGYDHAQAVRARHGDRVVFCRIIPLERPRWPFGAQEPVVVIEEGRIDC